METNQNPTVATENTAVVAEGRPWQGTFLAVLGIIGLVILGIVIPMLFVGASFLAALLPASLAGITMIIAFVFIAMWVLELFIVMGTFKGQKWAIIVTMIFSALGLLGGFYPSMNIVTLALNGFMIYLAFACLKHPFYNKK